MENPIKMDDLEVPWEYHYFWKHPYMSDMSNQANPNNADPQETNKNRLFVCCTNLKSKVYIGLIIKGTPSRGFFSPFSI